MGPVATTLLSSLGAIVACVIALWVVSLARRDSSVVDPFWGFGFVIVVWIAWFLQPVATPRSTLFAVLTTCWGLRLSGYLVWRNRGHGEDRRYAAMRAYHGDRYWWVSLVTVFLLQAIILWFVAFPQQLTIAFGQADPLGWMDAVGILVWLCGFFFETVGDLQLARFRADPNNAGRVLDTGLWAYTRHPNYFGDTCVWWGFYLIAVAGGAAWTVGSPLLMTVLLMRVSGVTLLERDIGDRRPDYAAYKLRTNAFFPGPRRRLK
jgi:steroid 5-alpha reductase family enzyme